jgi:PAS domain S-box-containing protein
MSTGPESEPLPSELLRQSEECFRLLVEQVRDYAIFMLGPQGHIVTWNAGAERIKGYRPEEIIGRHFSVFFPVEEVQAGKPSRELVVAAAEGRFEDEGWRLRKDGTRFWANVVITALHDRSGELQGFAKVTRDLTGRVKGEEQARLLAAERAARAEAEAASRRKDEFLAMLAHELRNPLAPILTSLAILRRSVDPSVFPPVLDMMERQVRHLKRMMDDLLDVGRIARGKVRLQPDRLDLARLVRTVASDYRAVVEGAGLALEAQTPDTPVWARADEARLAQVLSNLLDNATKFTDRGGTVRVILGPGPAPGEATLTVSDTGVGIPARVLPHLFEPLTQADRSLERSRGGLGLGLAVVRGLVELHGGRVEAFSAGEGKGSRFTVHLPVESEPAALAAPPAPQRPTVRRLRVVVVEDNRDAADSLRVLLECLGYEARVAFTGPEGVRTALDWGPDVVLTDVGLPGLSGLDLATELRKHPETASALLVGISGYGSDDDLRRARAAGMDHYLVKPADPARLQQILASRAASKA